MQKSLAGKKVNKTLRLGEFRDLMVEQVCLEFTNESDFTLDKVYHYNYNSDSEGSDTDSKEIGHGSGTYEVLSTIPEKKETVVKLTFSKYTKTKNKKVEDFPNLTLVAHIFDVYRDDIYFDNKNIFKLHEKENLFENIWEKEIDMLVRCDIPREEAYKRIFDYFEDVVKDGTYMHSYSYSVVVDVVYEIFQRSFPEKTDHLSNVYLWLEPYFGDDFYVRDLCVMWKKAGFKLDTLLKQNNLEAHRGKIRQELRDLYRNSIPEELEI